MKKTLKINKSSFEYTNFDAVPFAALGAADRAEALGVVAALKRFESLVQWLRSWFKTTPSATYRHGRPVLKHS